MNNYLVHLRTTKAGVKEQTYLCIVAEDQARAEGIAERLALLMPGKVTVLSVDLVGW